MSSPAALKLKKVVFDGVPFYYQGRALEFCKTVEKRNEAKFAYQKMFFVAIQIAAIAMAAFTAYLLLPPVAGLNAILLSALSTFALCKIYSLGKNALEAKYEVKKHAVVQMNHVAMRLELEAVVPPKA